jgi:oligopeptide/dipeptide ABC transporter ATP-binding protein
MSRVVLDLRDVHTHFPLRKGHVFQRTVGVIRAVDGVTLKVSRGETLGLVGESGCGKSTLARSILRLVPVTAGEVWIEGEDFLGLDRDTLRRARRKVQMIFQDPYASLNPRMTVFDIIAEPLRLHRLAPRRRLAERVGMLMEKVGLARRTMRKYPHEFSGGQRQRIAIARALAVEPTILVADEPVSALDVSVQAQILNLLLDLRRDANLTMIFISHDLSVVKHIADRIAVMYLGKIVEIGGAGEVFDHPRHPYTRALLDAVPIADPQRIRKGAKLPGDPPSPMHPPEGCAFHPRCSRADAKCRDMEPELGPRISNHQTACYHPLDGE